VICDICHKRPSTFDDMARCAECDDALTARREARGPAAPCILGCGRPCKPGTGRPYCAEHDAVQA
jgi:hypothetical protein